MDYVDGYLVAVPNKNKEAYLKMATDVADVFKENGATQVVETWGEDVKPGKKTSFPQALQLEDDESVVFSWIIWPSREVRDAGMKKAMADPRMMPEEGKHTFDGSRMIFGGFEMILKA